MLRKASLVFYALIVGGVVAWKVFEIQASCHSEGEVVPVDLTRGSFDLLVFPSKTNEVRAIVIFGSGDGGWSGFEEVMSQALQDKGYEVVGVDSFAYAKTDYDLGILQNDFSRIAAKAEEPYRKHPVPVIVGGWSMGAEQAIAVAGGPNPPPGLAGLIVLDPMDRGRYGLRVSDRINLLPTGPGTFGMEEFDRTIGNIRVAQWHAAQDPIDSRKWLMELLAKHKEFDFDKSGHYYNNDRREFLEEFVESLEWVMKPDPTPVMATGRNS